MIKDPTKWNLALARLSGFMQSVREPYDDEKVQQYQDILGLLEEASLADLSSFRVPPDKLKPRIIGARRASYSGQPGHIQYSAHKDCDPEFFRSQLFGLANYLPLIKGKPSAENANPYESLSDDKLTELLANRKLKPKRVVDENGEHYIFERADAIAKLIKDDIEPNAPTVSHISNTYNIRDSNIIQSSPGAAVTQTIGLKAEELLKIVAELKLFSAIEGIAPENRRQIKADAATMDAQIESGNPNPTIIRASLESAKSVVERAGAVQGEGVLAAIRRYLGVS